MSKINLESIKIPTKEISVPLFEDTVTIYPITGLGLLKLKSLSEIFEKNAEDEKAQRDAIELTLRYGCKCTDEEIQFLIDNAYLSCIEILKEVLEFSTDFAQETFKESEKSKKKLKK